MSAWKRVALEKLPEYRQVIDASESPMALWVELHCRFQEAYQSAAPDDLIRRFYEYARWCRQSSGTGSELSDAGTAAVCAFYEHLPRDAAARRDLRRWVTRAEFSDLREVFRYHLSEHEFTEFEAEFLRAPKRGASR
jgi:hypothetical protein